MLLVPFDFKPCIVIVSNMYPMILTVFNLNVKLLQCVQLVSLICTSDVYLQIAAVVNQALAEHFPEEGNVRVIAEPGRYFVASAFTLAVNVIAKRVVARDAEISSPDQGMYLRKERLLHPRACM